MKRLLPIFALVCVLASTAQAQVPVGLAPVPKPVFTANGVPLVAGCLSTFAAGTTTPLASYTDSTGTVPNTNPIILDANGSPANAVYLTSAAYKFQLKSAGGSNCVSGATIWTADNVSAPAFLNVANTWSALQTFSAGISVTTLTATSATITTLTSPTANNVVNASAQAGATPCLQMQAAVTAAVVGGRIDANFTSSQLSTACNESPFANVAGTQTAGRLMLGGGTITLNNQWVIPSKWLVEGTGGYGGNNCLNTADTSDPTVLKAGASFIAQVNISSISRSGNIVTVNTSGPTGLAVNNHVVILGVTDSSYNGGFPVASVGTNTFTYAQTAGNSSSSSGTVTIPLIEIGDKPDFSLGAMLRFLVIDGNNVANLVPVDSNSMNQESGLEHVKVRNFTSANGGIRIVAEGPSGFPQNFMLQHVSVCPGPSATNSTLAIVYTAPVYSGKNIETEMDDVTVNGSPANVLDYPAVGFQFTNIGAGNFRNLSSEEVVQAYTCTSCFGGLFSSIIVGPQATTNGFHILSSSGFGPSFFNVANQNTSGSVPTILDDRFSPSISLLGANIIQYLRGGSSSTYIPGSFSGVGAPITGTGASVAVCSVAIPANYIGVGPAGFHVHWAAKHTTGTANVTYQVEYPSGTILQSGVSAVIGDVVGDSVVMNNAGVGNAQTIWNGPIVGNAFNGAPNTATAVVDTSVASTWRLTFNAAGTEQVTPRICWAELVW